MKDIPFVLQAERQIYGEYDRDRRLRIARMIAPAFATILTAVAVASLIVPQHFQGTRSNFGTVALCDALFVVGGFAAWRRRVNLATGSILAAALLLMALSILVNQPFMLSDLFTVPAVVIIGLSALIGLPWMILATTALTTLFVVVLSGSPSLANDLSNPNNVNSVGAFVIEQWILALIVYAAARGYRRILQIISDVRVQYERAKQLDELKDQFITSVNHELRNPVMLMQGYIDLLRLKGEELAPERRTQFVQQASVAGDNLAKLIQSVLSSRRADQGAREFTPEAVPVFEAVATAAGLVDPQDGRGLERELRVHVPPGLAIWGETVRLQQILVNLLSNAIKYSPPGTPVEVDARVLSEAPPAVSRWPRRRRDGRPVVELSVRDHGLGIPPAQAPLLFQRFVRLPRDLASTVVGNGLGLYLCRELAEAMGGRIWVESTGVEGQGSTFYLRLPLTAHAAPAQVS
jgi:signal transduction histidine kinase